MPGLLTPKGLRKLVEFLVGAFVDALQALLAVSAKGSGDVAVRMLMAGDFEEAANGDISFSGRLSAPVIEGVGGQAGGEWTRERERAADAAIRIEVTIRASVD